MGALWSDASSRTVRPRRSPPVVIHQPTMDAGYGQTSDLQIQVRCDIERDTILTGTEALAYGVVDEILGSRKHSSPGAEEADSAMDDIRLSA
jgi:ATP-dependent protease ClpP protease subunit